MTESITVFFNQKPGHRGVPRDRVNLVPPEIRALSPLRAGVAEAAPVEASASVAAGQGVEASASPGWLSRFVRTAPAMNLRKLPAQHEEADLAYTWGEIPLNARRPWIIEFENAYQPTFYNVRSTKILRPLLRGFLGSRSCRALSCWSEACKACVTHEFGETVGAKARVLYPAIRDPRSSPVAHDTVNFLFVGLDLVRKGGRELLTAFRAFKEPRARLLMVGQYDERWAAFAAEDDRITLRGEVSRQELYESIYPTTDVLVFPSLHESFGWVTLEALSFGIGIIATDVYALPEVVDSGYNGLLVPHPCVEPSDRAGRRVIDVTQWTQEELVEQLLDPEKPEEPLVRDLGAAFEQAMGQFAGWKTAARTRFDERFGPAASRAAYLRLFLGKGAS